MSRNQRTPAATSSKMALQQPPSNFAGPPTGNPRFDGQRANMHQQSQMYQHQNMKSSGSAGSNQMHPPTPKLSVSDAIGLISARLSQLEYQVNALNASSKTGGGAAKSDNVAALMNSYNDRFASLEGQLLDLANTVESGAATSGGAIGGGGVEVSLLKQQLDTITKHFKSEIAALKKEFPALKSQFEQFNARVMQLELAAPCEGGDAGEGIPDSVDL